MRRDGRAYALRDKKCPVCGKMFPPAAFHAYEENQVLFCSWTCYLRGRKGERKTPNAMRVVQYTKGGKFMREFESAVEAAFHIGVKPQSIRGCCNGTTKTSAGYVWRYKKEETSSGTVESIG